MKEVLSDKQVISTMTVYLFSSSVLLSYGVQAKQDAWLAIIIAAVLAAFFYLMYSRIMKIYAGMNMFDILLLVFGNIAGKIIILLYMLFSLHLGAHILVSFGAFIKNVALIDTPEMVILILLGLLCIFMVRAGIEVKGRYSAFIMPLLIIFILAMFALSSGDFQFNNLTPILYDGIIPVLKGSFSVFMIPFAELFLFTFVIAMDAKRNRPYKAFLLSLLIGTVVILLITLRNLMVLGGTLIQMVAYPSYITTSIIDVGKVFQRMEAMVSIVYIFGGSVENAVCLNVATGGLARLLNIKDYKSITGSVGLLMIILAYQLYDSNIELFNFTSNIYPFYAIPFLIILPIIITIAAEIKYRSMKGKAGKKG